MDNKEFGLQLEIRTKRFAISIVKLSAGLPNNAEGYVIKKQITKSGTSIGANYREANKTRSVADFYNKIMICIGEANETVYWLEIINEMKWAKLETTQEISKEANELIAIFTSIAIKLKNKKEIIINNIKQ